MVDHPTVEELARLVDGTADDVERGLLIEHLSRCRSCMAAYSDAIRYRTAHLARPEAFRRPKDLDTAAPATRDIRPIYRARPMRFLLVSAAAAASVALYFGLRSGRQPRGIEPSWQPPAAVRTAVDHSFSSDFILPGARSFELSGPVMRAGDAVPAALLASLDSMATLFAQNKLDSAGTYWMISGTAAAGDLNRAETYLKIARDRNPDDAALFLLAAGIAYKQSDLESSERLLRRSLEVDSLSEAARYDLALIQAETGRESEALPMLDGLTRATNPLVRTRALALLDEFGGRDSSDSSR